MEIVEVDGLCVQEAIGVHLRLLQQHLRALPSDLRALRVRRRAPALQRRAALPLQVLLVDGVVGHRNVDWRSGRRVSELDGFPALRDNLRRVDDLTHLCLLSSAVVLAAVRVRPASHRRHINHGVLRIATGGADVDPRYLTTVSAGVNAAQVNMPGA